MAAFSHASSTATGAGTAIDCAVNVNPGFPPVMHCTGGGTITYRIEASQDNVNWVSYGTFTSDVAKSLVPNVRFWRTYIVSSTTAFTSSVGPVVGVDGRYQQPGPVPAGYSAGL